MPKEKTLEQLVNSNKFLKALLKEKLKNPKLLVEDKKESEKSEKELFQDDLFARVFEIIDRLTLLDLCPGLIISAPKDKIWKRKDVYRSTYINYNLESYLINLTGSFDRCLLLVNELYDLGLAEKHVKYKILRSNKHLQNKRPMKMLSKIFKNIESFRFARNVVVHREKLSDGTLNSLEVKEYALKKVKKQINTNDYKRLLKYLDNNIQNILNRYPAI